MARKLTPPKTIRLAGRTFNLVIAPDPAGPDSATAYCGLYSVVGGEITINSDMILDQQKATVVHECLHDFDHQSSYDLGEARVNTIAALIFAWMRDNPDLIKWIIQE